MKKLGPLKKSFNQITNLVQNLEDLRHVHFTPWMQLKHGKWYQGEIDVAGQREGRGITLTPEWQLQMGHYCDG